jgi:hypothetical protein
MERREPLKKDDIFVRIKKRATGFGGPVAKTRLTRTLLASC